ncbi:MAG: chromate efflux transporter [Gemmatimonadota bacterium]
MTPLVAGAEPALESDTRTWARVALQSFGGPAGQIAVLHRITVEEKRWLDEQQFLNALGYCMLLPGPEAHQLATYIGWLRGGVAGGIIAGGLFVMPGFVAILALSVLYVTLGQAGVVAALFAGLKPAVLAIVLEAVLRLHKRAARGPFGVFLGVASFAGLFFLGVPFPFIVLVAGVLGFFSGSRTAPDRDQAATTLPVSGLLFPALRTAAFWLIVWLVPVAFIVVAVGRDHVISDLASFFSQAAVVTFGGAYAVLSYVAQHAVEDRNWLTAGEMVDGLGMAETTPGPLIIVVQFVAFLAAFREPGHLAPFVSAVIGSLVTVWVTFIPSFLFIFASAPFINWLRAQVRLQAALGAVMAAVLGVVLNLGVWFGLHVLFREVRQVEAGPFEFAMPRPESVDILSVALFLLALVAVLRFKVGMLTVLGASALVGVVVRLAF